jgi:hypothetical protein
MSGSNSNKAKMIEVKHKKLIIGRSYFFKRRDDNLEPGQQLYLVNKRVGTYVGEKDGWTYFKDVKSVHPDYKDMIPTGETAISFSRYTPRDYIFYQNTKDALNHYLEQRGVIEQISQKTNRLIDHWFNPDEKFNFSEPYRYGKKSSNSSNSSKKSKKSKKGGKRGKRKTMKYLRL